MSDQGWELSIASMRIRANLPGALAADIEAFLKASN